MLRHVGGATLAAIAVWQTQQPPQTPPVFRAGTTVVPLTVTVLNKQGLPITDLTQADFTVLENNVRQDLRHFFPQPLTPQSTGAPAEPTSAAAAGPLAAENRRSILIVLGHGRIDVPGRAVEGAMRFVREHVMPQDRVSVFGFNRASAFTTDHAQTLAVLERYRRTHGRLFFEISEHGRRYGGLDLPPAIQRDIDAIFAGGPMRNAVDLLLGMDSLQPLTERAWNRQPTLKDLQTQQDRVGGRLSATVVGVPTIKLYAGIEYLRHEPGQRRLIWLGGGLKFRSVEDDKRMAARASDARVVLDVIHTTGVDSRAVMWDIAAAQRITELTGGFFTGVRYADEALAKVAERSRFSYLLGYTPSNNAMDGTYRNVKVVVNRPDVTVLFQHGYYAVGELQPLERREMLTTARLTSAGGFDEALTGINVKVTAARLMTDSASPAMQIDLLIDATKLTFASMADRRTASVDVHVFCGDSKESVVGDLKRRVSLNYTEVRLAEVQASGVPVSLRIPVTGPVKYVKAVVYDYDADLVGSYFHVVK